MRLNFILCIALLAVIVVVWDTANGDDESESGNRGAGAKVLVETKGEALLLFHAFAAKKYADFKSEMRIAYYVHEDETHWRILPYVAIQSGIGYTFKGVSTPLVATKINKASCAIEFEELTLEEGAELVFPNVPNEGFNQDVIDELDELDTNCP